MVSNLWFGASQRFCKTFRSGSKYTNKTEVVMIFLVFLFLFFISKPIQVISHRRELLCQSDLSFTSVLFTSAVLWAQTWDTNIFQIFMKAKRWKIKLRSGLCTEQHFHFHCHQFAQSFKVYLLQRERERSTIQNILLLQLRADQTLHHGS